MFCAPPGIIIYTVIGMPFKALLLLVFNPQNVSYSHKNDDMYRKIASFGAKHSPGL
jgi:hypothetical protein